MTKAKKWLNDNKIMMLGAVVLGTAWLFLYSTALAADEAPLWQNQIIRLHVLAHDDSDEEQALKLAIRDGIWEFVDSLVHGANNADSARAIIAENMHEITATAQKIAIDNGSNHAISTQLVQNLDFPATSYAGLVFPQGRYEALQIYIGDGSGQNWWCVMFPPMCLIELSQAQVIETGGDDVAMRPRFKLAEIWQGWFE